MTAPAIIVDILELESAMKPTFTVNSAVAEVSVLPVFTGSFFSKNGDGSHYYFSAADNLLLLSLGIVFPYCFGYGTTPIQASLYWDGASGTTASISNTLVPLENEELSLAGSKSDGLFLQHYSLVKPAAGIKGRLGLSISLGSASQVNVPASFPDGTVIGVGFFLKVQHQLPMVT